VIAAALDGRDPTEVPATIAEARAATRQDVREHAPIGSAFPIANVFRILTLRNQVWRHSRDGDERVKFTEALFTFVALDTGGRPRAGPSM